MKNISIIKKTIIISKLPILHFYLNILLLLHLVLFKKKSSGKIKKLEYTKLQVVYCLISSKMVSFDYSIQWFIIENMSV